MTDRWSNHCQSNHGLIPDFTSTLIKLLDHSNQTPIHTWPHLTSPTPPDIFHNPWALADQSIFQSTLSRIHHLLHHLTSVHLHHRFSLYSLPPSYHILLPSSSHAVLIKSVPPSSDSFFFNPLHNQNWSTLLPWYLFATGQLFSSATDHICFWYMLKEKVFFVSSNVGVFGRDSFDENYVLLKVLLRRIWEFSYSWWWDDSLRWVQQS